MLLAMSLQNAEAVRVKEEPEWEDKMSAHDLQAQCEVKEEAEAGTPEKEPKREEDGLAGYSDREAEEREWESASCVSEAAAQACLYRGHEVKEEIVVGPEEFHRPKPLLASQEPSEEENQNEQLRTNTMNKTSIIPGEKAYKCAHCSYTSTFKNYLQQHQLSHTKEKPGVVEEGPDKEEDRQAGDLDCEVKLKGKPRTYAGAATVRSRRGRAVKERGLTSEEEPKREEDGPPVNSDHEAEEREWDSASGVSKAAAQACLYRDHAVKEEIVVGPEEFHRPKPLLASQEPSKEGKQNGHSRTNTTTQILHSTPVKDMSHKCPHCSYATDFVENLQHHVRIHKYLQSNPAYTDESILLLHVNKDVASDQPYKSDLQKHLKSHTKEKPYKCIYCSYACTKKSVLQKHQRIHSGEVLYKCAHCSYTSTFKIYLLQHQLSHTREKPRTAKEGSDKEEDGLAGDLDCEVKLKGKPRSYAGAVTVRSGRGRAVKEPGRTSEEEPKREEVGPPVNSDREMEEWESASGVSEAAAQACLYRGHEVKEEIVVGPEEFHRPKPLLASQEPSEEEDQNEQLRINTMNETSLIPESTPSKERLHKCIHCCYATDLVENLQRHVRIHYSCVYCKRTFSDESSLLVHVHVCSLSTAHSRTLKVHARCHNGENEKAYICAHCSYATAHKSYMIQHQKIHTKENLYECAHCSYATAHKSYMKQHQKIHTKENLYECAHCSYATAHKSYMKQHQKIHTKEKLYECAHCSFATASSITLKSHVFMHTGEKQYKCAHCSYATAHKRYMKGHQLIHTKEKKYKCTHCSFSTVHSRSLKIHARYHTKDKLYECAQCSFVTATNFNLKLHARRHTGEKPYKCAQCNYASAFKSLLQKHQNCHAKEKPYKCGHCSYASALSSSLKSHERRCRDKKPTGIGYLGGGFRAFKAPPLVIDAVLPKGVQLYHTMT